MEDLEQKNRGGVYHRATLSSAASLTVHGQKDGSVSLPSNKSIGENLTLRLTCRSKVAYGGQQNEQFKGRVNKSDLCGLIIKDVKTTDAGKYTLSIHGNGDPIYTSFDIHVIVNLTVRKGEELVFDDRPLEAETVERCNGTVWSEMWRSGRGVLNERLNDSNGRLVRRFAYELASRYGCKYPSGRDATEMVGKDRLTSFIERNNTLSVNGDSLGLSGESRSGGGATEEDLELTVLLYLSVGGSSDVRVRMGENITLNCSMRNRDEVAWYRLRSEELVLLISAEKDKTGRRLLTTYNQNRTRMKMTADSWVTRVSLTISGVTESDSGLYFYGIKSDTPEMHFNKPIRLEIEELPKEEDITELPKEEDITELPKEEDITDGVTVTVLMFAGVGLAVFVFLLTIVVGGVISYHRGQQKEWRAAKQEALMNQKKKPNPYLTI
ncbi:unnamed protein product [Leuciscus chuanchicus]